MDRDDEAVWQEGEEPIGRRRVRALIALLTVSAALLLVMLVYLVHRTGDERDRAQRRTEHSFAVVLLIEQTRGAIARSEAALGRFTVDGNPNTGQLYYDAWREAGDDLDRLGRLVSDNREQAALVDRLRALYLQRGRETALVATRASYKQGWQALSFFYKASRTPTLPAMRDIIRAVSSSETVLLDRRASFLALRVDRANDLTTLLSLVGVLLALSVFGLAWAAARALSERRVASARAEIEAERATYLEQAVTARTRELQSANEKLLAEAETRAAAEARLRQVQKMDAVGQLTGGIAHDFNNMLLVVLGGLEMARRRLDDKAIDTRRYLDQAREGAERAAALTRRLLSFSRAEPLLPTAVAPATLLQGLSDLIDRSIGERIAVRIEAAPDAWPVWIDAYQLENAVLNLAVNARDAMGGAGALTMSVGNALLDDGEVGALPAGDYVRVSVSDTGAGMTPDVLERVFEPFFTTKPVGQGTGLGLSQTLGFARQSGGDVLLVSAPGEGTTVSIYLPRHGQGGLWSAPVAGAREPLAAGQLAGAVLLVEDDPRVRTATEEALEELGHRVTSFASGPEALDHLRRVDGVALLMTDVVMPEMSGVELVRQVRIRMPQLPVLFVTGYVGEAGDREDFGDAPVLRKPFTLAALSGAIAKIANRA